jgi:hypothetical protein
MFRELRESVWRAQEQRDLALTNNALEAFIEPVRQHIPVDLSPPATNVWKMLRQDLKEIISLHLGPDLSAISGCAKIPPPDLTPPQL